MSLWLWGWLCLITMVALGCAEPGSSEGGDESVPLASDEVIHWLKRLPFREADNHHATPPSEPVPSYEEWLEEGRNVPNIGEQLNRIMATLDSRADMAQVAFAMGRLGNSRSVLLLIDALVADDVYLRIEAAAALGKLRSEDAVAPLCAALDSDADLNVRANAAASLGQYPDKEARAWLEKAASNDESEFVREMATKALESKKPTN